MQKRTFTTPTLQEIIAQRTSRREFLAGGGRLGLAALAVPLLPSLTACAMEKAAPTEVSAGSLTFAEIAKSDAATHTLAAGYRAEVLLRWGDSLDGKTAFDPLHLTADAQAQRFGYNNDFTAFLPITPGTQNATHGLLFVNHEYTDARLMFPGLTRAEEVSGVSEAQARIQQQAMGFSVVEIRKGEEGWRIIPASIYSMRVTVTTPIRISGPAAGHARMKTSEDTLGILVKGTMTNCGGGVTPWGTVLTCEENFNTAFYGTLTGHGETGNHQRYDIGEELEYPWYKWDTRFDATKEPNEPNRFGWIVEYDPYHPEKPPVKRTALGRLKHESADCVQTLDGRVVVYSGDDDEFEYIYRFVSARPINPYRREANDGLLDDGTLSVARFYGDGTLEWLPLVHGQGPLTEANGFHSQADVLIETRRAADLLGATPMDRPEDVEVNPKTGLLYVTLTKNKARRETNIVNPRAPNPFGHILEILPKKVNGKRDHGRDKMRWQIFLQGGDPSNPAHDAHYLAPVSANGWLACPDNIAFDPKGRIWIATDGQPEAIGRNDGLYAAETEGPYRGAPLLFFSGPRGSEIAGPSFTPDGKTLFLSVQHPGEFPITSTFDAPNTRWPDFKDDLPPRPAVLAITKDDGGEIGS